MTGVDFSFTNIINIFAETIFGGNTTVAGLVIMCGVMFIGMAILANMKAPVQYGLVPAMIMAIIFASIGIMDPTVSFIIIIVSAVMVAMTARRMVS